MEYKNIIFTQENSIAKITLNLPEMLNPLTMDMLAEIQDVLGKMEEADELKVLVITGSGRAFSAGGDVKAMQSFYEMNPGQLQEMLHKAHRSAVMMRKLEKPIIAQVNGLTYGAGLDFILACDLRIASSKARFCEAYIRVGVSPGMGALYMLPRYVGFGRALNMILTSKEIDAEEAERIGLVDVVVPPDKLEEVTKEYATKLATGPSKAIGVVKRALLRGLTATFETEQAWTAYEQVIEFITRDAREGLTAFVEKRAPKFTGQYE